MMQQLEEEKCRAFEYELEACVISRCPDIFFGSVPFAEMSRLLRTFVLLQSELYPEYVTASGTLGTMQTNADICKAARLNRKTTTRIALQIFHEMLPLLHEKYSLRQMAAFTRAYRQEDCCHNNELPLPLLRPSGFSINVAEANHQAACERIALSTCCKPVGSVSEGTECSI